MSPARKSDGKAVPGGILRKDPDPPSQRPLDQLMREDPDPVDLPVDTRSAERMARLVQRWWNELPPESQVKVIHQAYLRFQGEGIEPETSPASEHFSSYFRRNV